MKQRDKKITKFTILILSVYFTTKSAKMWQAVLLNFD